MPISEADIFLRLNALDALRQRYIKFNEYNPLTENEQIWAAAIRAMDEVWKIISVHPNLSVKFLKLLEEAAKARFTASNELQRFGEEEGLKLAREMYDWHMPVGISTDYDRAAGQIKADIDEIGRLLPYLFEVVKQKLNDE